MSFNSYGKDNESSDLNEFFSSLIFFSYPNSYNINFDIMEYILSSNKTIENDIMINFEESLIIQNILVMFIM